MTSKGHTDEALARARRLEPVPVAVVHPVSASALRAIVEGRAAGLIAPVLVGPEGKVRAAAETAQIDLAGLEIVDAAHSHDAATRGAALGASGEVRALMKGSLHSDELLTAVLAEPALRTGRRMSHAYLFDDPDYHKPFMVTDGAVNIAPTLAHKADIVRNAVGLTKALNGKDFRPKIAALAAVETVNPAMPATIDAAALAKMGDRGQLGDCLIDGPLAFDNAISAVAAAEKGIASPVAGDPDVLLVPDLEAGNMLAKQLTFLGNAEAAAIVLGARLPIALTSRADGARTRLLSCALLCLVDAARRQATL